MADEVDMTTDRDELEAPARLAASRRPEFPPANGQCFSCSAPTPPGLRYCDAECGIDHLRVIRAAELGGQR